MCIVGMGIGGVAFRSVGMSTVFAEECHEPQAEHVERGHEGSKDADCPIGPACLIGAPKDFILAEKAGERKNSGDGECSHGHGPEGDRYLAAQSAHLTHIL